MCGMCVHVWCAYVVYVGVGVCGEGWWYESGVVKKDVCACVCACICVPVCACVYVCVCMSVW